MEVQTVASKLACEFNDRLARSNKDTNIKVVRIETEKSCHFMTDIKRFREPTTEMVKYIKTTSTTTKDKKAYRNRLFFWPILLLYPLS